MRDEKTKVIVIVDDRFWKSAGRGVVSFATMAAMIGLGVLLGSSAMQWVGGILFFLFMVGSASKTDANSKMTIQQAREFLDGLEETNAR